MLRRGIVLKAVLVLALALMASVGLGQRTPGVTPTEIVVGTWAPLSGPAAAWGTLTRGMDAYFQHINAQGGIHGRRIRLEVRDDVYMPARTVAVVRELIDRVGVFAFVGGVGTANGLAAQQFILEAGVPWISPATGASIWANPPKHYIFATFTNYIVEAALLTRHAVTQMGKTRIGVLYQNDMFGRDGLTGVQQEIARLAGRATLVAAIPYEPAETRMLLQAQRFREAGAEVIIIWSTPPVAASIAVETRALGFTPQLMTSSVVADPILFQLAGDAWEGAILASFLPLPGVDPEATAVFQNIIMRYAPDAARQPFFALAGVAFAEPFVEALRRAGPQLTRERLIAALESLRNFNEGLLDNITFGAFQRQGQNSIYLLQARERRLVPISDWIRF